MNEMSTKPIPGRHFDPSAAYDWTRPKEKIRCELAALKLLMGEITRTQVLWGTLLLLFWMGWTTAIAAGVIATPEPPYNRVILAVYGGVTIILGIIFGRQWDFKLEEIASMSDTISITLSNADADDDNEDD